MTDNARNQAIAQMEDIVDMLSTYNMDWDHYGALQGYEESDLDEDELTELQELTELAADCESQDEALERLEENPLSVLYRSGWEHDPNDLTPSEFEILLCTGGPAVRIMGSLDHNGNPTHAWVEYQDWYKPWTELGLYQAIALDYASLLIYL